MTRLSEIQLIDPVDESAIDAVTSLPVFDDLRRETIAMKAASGADARVFEVRLRDHRQIRRPLVLSAAAVLVLVAGVIVVVRSNSALTHPVTTAWEPGQVFSPSLGNRTHHKVGTWRLVDDVLTGAWQQNSSGPPPGSLDCPAASVCYVMSGHYPNASADAPLLGEFLYVSMDVGATWTVFAMPGGFAPTSSLSCPDADTCAAGGTYRGQPVLITTSNGGHTFTIDPLPSVVGDAYVLSCPATGVCDALVATRADSATGAPLDATFLTTTNGGASFTDHPIASGDSMSGLDCPSVLACTAIGTSDAAVNDWTSGLAAATSDGGRTWTVNPLPAGFGVSYVSQLSCPDTTHCAVTGFVAGTGGDTTVGDIATTSNGGRTWTPDTMPTDVPQPQFSGLSCPTATECWASGSEAIPERIGNVINGGSPMLLGTTNGGETWSKVTFSAPEGAPNYDSQSYLSMGVISCANADVCASLGAAAQGSPTTPVYSLMIPTSA